MRRLKWILICLTAWCGPAAASEGALEINQDCAESGCFPGDAAGFPVTLTSGGAYRLTSDLAVSTASNGIVIQTASKVDIDLGGFTLSGGGTCTDTPVTACSAGNGLNGVTSPSLAHVRLHNGTIRGFASSNVQLSQLLDGSEFEDLLLTESVAVGFASMSLSTTGTTGRTVLLRNVTVSRNRNVGIIASGTTTHYVIDGLVVSGNGGIGASLNQSATIRGASFHRNGGFGISTTQVIALGNTSFFGNNGGSTANQFSITTLLNMGGVVCEDASCP